MRELMFRDGVRSFKMKLAGTEHSIFFKAKSPQEIAVFLGGERRYPDNADGDLAREKARASFIATALCDEGGTLSFANVEEAMRLPINVKLELTNSIVRESGKTDAELGKG